MSDLPLLSLSDISKHNTYSSCWIIINNRVYDITSFLTSHPGGSKIILLHSGKDCTDMFMNMHNEKYLYTYLNNSLIGRVGEEIIPRPIINKNIKIPKLLNVDTILSGKRNLYLPEHETFRKNFNTYLYNNVLPKYHSFEIHGQVDEAAYRSMFDAGYYLKLNIPKEFGGLGLTDWRYNAVICEELENLDIGGFFVNLGNDMVLSYFTKSCNEQQRAKWLPKIIKEKSILAVAMSEPEIGSDLGALSTRAVLTDDKKHYIVNGRKMWISAGNVSDLFVIAVVTDPTKKQKGISLIVVEKGMAGFSSSKRVGKIGKLASDTCLLVLKDVKVPVENIIGDVGKGFIYLMSHLAKERLSIAVGSVAAARRGLALTVNYVNGREAFGNTVGRLQNVQLTLAKLRTDIEVCTAFVDRCIAQISDNELTAETAAMAKVQATELSNHVANTCLQYFGGYGYLKASPIAKIFVDQRVTKIYGGANEVLLEIISKGLGFQPQRFHSKL